MALDLEALRGHALDLADTADRIALAHFGGLLSATTKADGSPVTAADAAIESALRDRIATALPAHAVLGEEEGGHIDAEVPTWVIDPIDATKNFMRGVPVFATLIGLVVDGREVLGVASAPAMGERWVAVDGGGATRNGERIGVSAVATLADAHVLHGGLEWHRDKPGRWDALGRIVDRAWRTRGFGDYWMHLLVAAGAADVAFERDLRPWDVAALACIVREAGGRMTAFDGSSSSLLTGEALTTNGLLHDELVAALAPQ